jgi:hypothetical protein
MGQAAQMCKSGKLVVFQAETVELTLAPLTVAKVT